MWGGEPEKDDVKDHIHQIDIHGDFTLVLQPRIGLGANYASAQNSTDQGDDAVDGHDILGMADVLIVVRDHGHLAIHDNAGEQICEDGNVDVLIAHGLELTGD